MLQLSDFKQFQIISTIASHSKGYLFVRVTFYLVPMIRFAISEVQNPPELNWCYKTLQEALEDFNGL